MTAMPGRSTTASALWRGHGKVDESFKQKLLHESEMYPSALKSSMSWISFCIFDAYSPSEIPTPLDVALAIGRECGSIRN